MKRRIVSLVLASAMIFTMFSMAGIQVNAAETQPIPDTGIISGDGGNYSAESAGFIILSNADDNTVNVKKDVDGSTSPVGAGIGIAASSGNEVTVGGNVSGTSSGILFRTAVGETYYEVSENTIDVLGNVTGNSGNGIFIDGTKNNVNVSGNVSGSLVGLVVADDANNNTVNIKGNVNSELYGINSWGEDNLVNVTGNVNVNGNKPGRAVGINSYPSGEGNIINVKGNISASNSEESMGIVVQSTGDDFYVSGDVTGKTASIAEFIDNEDSLGNSNFTVLGTANGSVFIGIDKDATDVDAEYEKVGNIIVGAISTDKKAVQGITVDEEGKEGTSDTASQVAEKVSTNKIYYILNTEKIDNGTISVTTASNLVEVKDSDGNVLKDKNGNTLYAANRSNTVNIKLEAAYGYQITSVSAGKATLTKNADGSYTLTIPEGGGVDISAIIQAISGGITVEDFSAGVAAAYQTAMKAVAVPVVNKVPGIESVQSGNWSQVTNALNTNDASASDNGLMKLDMAGNADMTVPTNIIDSLKANAGVNQLHLLVGNDDAITFDESSDLTNYQPTNFAHNDVITENSRTIDFTSKQAIGAKVILHTTVPKANTIVKVYKMVNGQKKLMGKVKSNENGALCFAINETAEYVLEY